MRYFLYLTLLLSCLACTEQEPLPNDKVIEDPFLKKYPGVTQVLWRHFERFEREADLRGVSIDLQESGITGRITDIIGPDETAGTCYYHEDRPNAIVIDSLSWADVGELTHEFIVFHELGHCSLLREHLDDATDKGYCKSIMRSSWDVCVDNYSQENRSRFLDELFSK